MYSALTRYLAPLHGLRRHRLWRNPGRRLLLSELIAGPARRHEDDYGTHMRQTLAWVKQAGVAGGWGVSAGWSFAEGWLPACPAVSAELVESLLVVAPRVAQPSLAALAGQLLDGLVERVAGADAFLDAAGNALSPHDLGRLLRGLQVGWQLRGDDACRHAAATVAAQLLALQRADGALPAADGEGRAWHVTAAWALARYGRAVGDETCLAAARRLLDWTLSRQTACGWFADNADVAGNPPSTGAIVHALRGVLETAALLDDEAAFAAVGRGAKALLNRRRTDGALPAAFADGWQVGNSRVSVTAVAQAAVLWLRLEQLGRGQEWRHATPPALSYIKRTQRLAVAESPAIRGALPGAAPLWGAVPRFVYPAEAAKHFIDALAIDRTNAVIPPALDSAEGKSA